MPTFKSGFVSTANLLDGAVTNAKISASAAIAFSKLAALDNGKILIGNGSNVAVKNSVTGDVTILNTGVTAIGASKVTEAMHIFADNTTNNTSASTHGFCPKIPNNTTTFLRGDGTFAAALGAVTKKWASTGSTTNTSEEQIGANTFSASDFATTDIIWGWVDFQHVTALQRVNCVVRIFDGTNTLNLDLNSADFDEGYAYVEMQQGAARNTTLIWDVQRRDTADAVKTESAGKATMIANWLSASWTLSVRGDIDGGTSANFKWWFGSVS